MDTSRREALKLIGAGGGVLLSAALTQPVLAQQVDAVAAIAGASTSERDLKIVNFDLLEEEARTILTPGRFAFMGPAGDGWTYRENRRAFNDLPIMPRRLQGFGEAAIDLRTKLLGHDLSLPMFTAPMGSHGMIHQGAEVVTARGTGEAGTLYVSSGASTSTIENIGNATTGPKWFQIYMNRDMEINRWLVQRARAAGYTAIVLTADALGPGQSDEFIRLGRPFPPNLRPGNHDPALGGRGNFRDFKRDLGFGDIGFLREASGLPVVVKGVVHPQDIRQCLEAGAGAIWVSNHGGRQMDGVPGAISMLGNAADAVAGRVPVIFDSGIRRGIDVFKSLALGATAVAVGRPVLWGLAAGGSAGVKSVYAQLSGELRTAMLLSGVAKVTEIKREHLAKT